MCNLSLENKTQKVDSVLASMETLLSEYYYWIFKEFSHICEMDMLLNLMYWYFYFLFPLVERNECIVVSIPDPSYMSSFDFMPIELVSLVGSALPALFLELELHPYLHNYMHVIYAFISFVKFYWDFKSYPLSLFCYPYCLIC